MLYNTVNNVYNLVKEAAMAKAQMVLSKETILSRFSDWLTARKGLGEVTVKELVNTIKRYPELGTSPDEQAIEHHIIAMRKAGKSYSHICSTSLAFERYMEFIGKPMKLGRPKAPKSLIRGVLSEAEVAVLLAAAKTLREKAMLTLLAYGGLRTGRVLINGSILIYCAIAWQPIYYIGEPIFSLSKNSSDMHGYSTTMIYVHSAPQRMKMEYHMFAPSYL